MGPLVTPGLLISQSRQDLNTIYHMHTQTTSLTYPKYPCGQDALVFFVLWVPTVQKCKQAETDRERSGETERDYFV